MINFTKKNIGQIMQSMKFEVSLANKVSDFVQARKGKWEHTDWMMFYTNLVMNGHITNSQAQQDRLGILLEIYAAKYKQKQLRKHFISMF